MSVSVSGDVEWYWNALQVMQFWHTQMTLKWMEVLYLVMDLMSHIGTSLEYAKPKEISREITKLLSVHDNNTWNFEEREPPVENLQLDLCIRNGLPN